MWSREVFCVKCDMKIDELSSPTNEENGFGEALVLGESRRMHAVQTGCRGDVRGWRFGPWRETPEPKGEKSMKNVDEVVDHTKGNNIVSLGHGAHIRIISFAVRKETSDRLDIAIQLTFIGTPDTSWDFPTHLYFSYTKGDPNPVIRKHGPENDRKIITCAETLGLHMKEYLKKSYKDLYRRYMLGSKKPSVYKKRRKNDA
jgi:hypothetical protein